MMEKKNKFVPLLIIFLAIFVLAVMGVNHWILREIEQTTKLNRFIAPPIKSPSKNFKTVTSSMNLTPQTFREDDRPTPALKQQSPPSGPSKENQKIIYEIPLDSKFLVQ